MALQGPLVLLLTTVVCCVGVLHTNANKLPLGVLVSFVTFSGVSSDESIESQSGTLSRIVDPLGPLEKATASPAVLRLQNFYQRNTPWVMPRMEACHCLSFVVFFPWK